MKKYVCVHGHFYQPPRENPWTGEIDEQESAKPFHDWNERISSECYEPNTKAKILNGKDGSTQTLNNFAHISFDMGPTLLSWLRRKQPEVYQAILQGDRESVLENDGHGNAMAQVYNHMIMPLASRRDKVTQVLWGIRDFEFHFKRRPEGMWLAEAAVDRETLKIMAEQGILFTVLAPHQARRVRHVGFGQRWHTIHHEAVDPKHAYRILLDGGRHFHLFFYDGPISRAIAFQGLLGSGDQVVSRFMSAFGRRHDREQLVSAAIDGETFGHHHRFGEMALAYALKKFEEQHLAKVSNYAKFLSDVQSHWEADVYENSSWSCAHGVERWRSDCGCRINHDAGWNQKWRAGLREAFDFLKENIDRIFEKELASLLKDPWSARNDYIVVMLDPQKEKEKFLTRHQKKQLQAVDAQKVWNLLEAEKFSMFMYTSCGWFFDDLSGIEPVQCMKFAARAMELVQPYSKNDLAGPFLKILGDAKSNIPEQGSGADIFRRFAKSQGVLHGV